MFTSGHLGSRRLYALLLVLAMLLSLLIPTAVLSESISDAEVIAEITADEQPVSETAETTAEEPDDQAEEAIPADTEEPAATEAPAIVEEPTAEPAQEPTAEPTQEPTAEPTQEPTPIPVVVEEEEEIPAPETAAPEPVETATVEPEPADPEATAEPEAAEPDGVSTDESQLSTWKGVSLADNGNPLYLAPGEEYRLRVKFIGDIEEFEYTLTSSDPDVVEISDGNTVIGRASGAVIIELNPTDETIVYKASLNVVVRDPNKDLELQIVAYPNKNTINVGESISLDATLYDGLTKLRYGVYVDDLRWTSSDPSVASFRTYTYDEENDEVTGVGRISVYALNAGEATITVEDTVTHMSASFTLQADSLDQPTSINWGWIPETIKVDEDSETHEVIPTREYAYVYVTPTYKSLNPDVPFEVVWESSAPEVIAIEDSGFGRPADYNKALVAKSEGTSTITASCGTLKVSQEIIVAKEIELKSIDFSGWLYSESGGYHDIDTSKPINAVAGDGIDLFVEAQPEGARLPAGLVWKVNDDTVEEPNVGYYGFYDIEYTVPETPGTYTITAEFTDPTWNKTATVIVADPAVPVELQSVFVRYNNYNYTDITLNYNITELGHTMQLSAVKEPANAAGDIVWSTTISEKIATIDSATGLVTFKLDMFTELSKDKKWLSGTTKLYAFTASVGSKKATFNLGVTLKTDYAPLSVSLDQFATITHDIKDGRTMQLTATMSPNISSQYLPAPAWQSSSAAVATVDQTGLVTFLKAGKATITVTTWNKKYTKVTINVTDSVAPTAVQLSPSGTATMNVDDTLTIGASLLPLKGTTFDTLISANSSVTWTASGQTKAKEPIVEFVTSGGATITGAVVSGFDEEVKEAYIKAKNPGTAKITAKTANGKSATLTVTVSEAGSTAFKGYVFNWHLAGQSLTGGAAELLQNSLTVVEGQIFSISAGEQPEGSQAPALTYTVANPKKGAEVLRQVGATFTALAAGSATISTQYPVNGKAVKKSWTIKVIPAETISKFTLDISGTKELKIGQRLEIDYNITPDTQANRGAAASGIKWVSSKPAFAYFESGTRTLVAKSAGTTVVTATLGTGKTAKTAKVSVKVVDLSKPTAVRMNFTGTKEVSIGSTSQLSAQLSPVDSYSTLTYTTSDKKGKVLTVDSVTGVVTAKGVGTATVTVTTANKKTAKVAFKVVDPTVPTAITNLPASVTLKVGGHWGPYTPSLLPATATANRFKWSSSNPKIAAVDPDGRITAVKAGKATITVTIENVKKIKATIKVTVTK